MKGVENTTVYFVITAKLTLQKVLKAKSASFPTVIIAFEHLLTQLIALHKEGLVLTNFNSRHVLYDDVSHSFMLKLN